MKDKPHILILADPFGKPSYAPRLRFLCNYLTQWGYTLTVYTEAFQQYSFPHDYPIIEKPSYKHSWQWALLSFWSLLTDYRNRSFSSWLKKQIATQKYDIVFCTTFSTFPLRAAAEIAQQRKLPLFIDIRDIEEQIAGAQYQGHRQWWVRPFRQWYRMVNLHRRNKVLRKADCITTISPWHVNFLKQFNKNVHLIYNGYDPAQFYYEDVTYSKFLISYIGKIYEFQDTSLIEHIVKRLNISDISLNVHTPQQQPIPITAVGDEIRKSSICLVLTGKNAHGMMTTKFFEALGCEKPVLCIPSDNGVLAETIRSTNAGIASDNEEDIKNFIIEKYNEWKNIGFTHQTVVNKEQFSRLHQAQQFEQLFLSLVCN